MILLRTIVAFYFLMISQLVFAVQPDGTYWGELRQKADHESHAAVYWRCRFPIFYEKLKDQKFSRLKDYFYSECTARSFSEEIQGKVLRLAYTRGKEFVSFGGGFKEHYSAVLELLEALKFFGLLEYRSTVVVQDEDNIASQSGLHYTNYRYLDAGVVLEVKENSDRFEWVSKYWNGKKWAGLKIKGGSEYKIIVDPETRHCPIGALLETKERADSIFNDPKVGGVRFEGMVFGKVVCKGWITFSKDPWYELLNLTYNGASVKEGVNKLRDFVRLAGVNGSVYKDHSGRDILYYQDEDLLSNKGQDSDNPSAPSAAQAAIPPLIVPSIDSVE